jgi:hypothetical protein
MFVSTLRIFSLRAHPSSSPFDASCPQLHNHFHPSVQHFARRLLDGAAIEYLGDPLCV